ncbi:proline dehydrogenase family protein [Rhizobium rhizogenes]
MDAYTHKIHTDVAYVACAHKLLAAIDGIFPPFATHNAQTLATIYQLAGPDFQVGKHEFQYLHGMGEALYEEVVGKRNLDRPCRIYALVGTHEEQNGRCRSGPRARKHVGSGVTEGTCRSDR